MSDDALSRREFARRAAIVSAATLMHPSELPTAELVVPAPNPSRPQTDLKVPSPNQAEADLRTNAVLSQYGSRLSESQKTEIAKLSTAAQRQLDRIRAFPATNADDPALYLKPLVEREKNSVLKPPPPSSAPPSGLTPPAKKP